jgi:hypothetical protein
MRSHLIRVQTAACLTLVYTNTYIKEAVIVGSVFGAERHRYMILA